MEKLVNFRDLGGIKTEEGKTIIPKRLLRSGELVNISKKDIEILQSEYRLKMVFDFRDDSEVTINPDVVMEGVVYTHIDIMKDVQMDGVSTSKENLFKMVDIGQADEQMMYIYREIVLSQSASIGYRHFIKTVASLQEGSTLFHCFAGKDRTGIGAMILLKLLNVGEDAIMEDFIKTNVQRKEANIQVVNHARNSGIEEEKLQVLHTFLSVKESYLEAAYDAIRERYGFFDAYVASGLKIEQDVIKRLRENYLR